MSWAIVIANHKFHQTSFEFFPLRYGDFGKDDTVDWENIGSPRITKTQLISTEMLHWKDSICFCSMGNHIIPCPNVECTAAPCHQHVIAVTLFPRGVPAHDFQHPVRGRRRIPVPGDGNNHDTCHAQSHCHTDRVLYVLVHSETFGSPTKDFFGKCLSVL